MRRIDLTPGARRAPERHGERRGSAYVVVGSLGVLVACMFAFIAATTWLHSREDELSRLEQEAAAAAASSATLEPFEEYARIAETRAGSVSALAEARFDWERLTRELAHVLPSGVWVTRLETTSKAEPQEAEGGEPAAGTKAPAGPVLQLSGCAGRQGDVARTLLRLRGLSRAESVRLGRSSREGGGEASASSDEPRLVGGGAAGCARGSGAGYSFEATVTFTPGPTPGDGAEARPASAEGTP